MNDDDAPPTTKRSAREPRPVTDPPEAIDDLDRFLLSLTTAQLPELSRILTPEQKARVLHLYTTATQRRGVHEPGDPKRPTLRSFCRLCDEAIAVLDGTKPAGHVCTRCAKSLEEDRRAREANRCAVCAKLDDAAAPLCNGCRLAVVRGVQSRLRARGRVGGFLAGLLGRPAVQGRLAGALGPELAAFLDVGEHHDC